MRKLTFTLIVFAICAFSIIDGNCQTSVATERSEAPVASADKKYSIKAHPVQGQINSKAFICETSQIEDGILTIRQGKEFFSDREIKVFLFLPKGEIPAQKVFRVVEGETSAYGNPHVIVSSMEEGASIPRSKSYTGNYALYLEFGKQMHKKLPGKIYLSISDVPATSIEGTFEADVKGLLLIDGKPDLTSDSFDTLQYVAKMYLQKEYKNQDVKDLNFRDAFYAHAHPSKKYQVGYIETGYRVDEGKPLVKRFQFVKEPGGWRVFSTLRKDQIHSAHPIELPDSKDPLAGLFEYLLAKKIEEATQKQFPGKAIYTGMGFGNRCVYNPLVSMGDCKANYTVEGDKEPIEKAYLFRLTDKGWILDRELGKNEKVNYKKGMIENSAK